MSYAVGFVFVFAVSELLCQTSLYLWCVAVSLTIHAI